MSVVAVFCERTKYFLHPRTRGGVEMVYSTGIRITVVIRPNESRRPARGRSLDPIRVRSPRRPGRDRRVD